MRLFQSLLSRQHLLSRHISLYHHHHQQHHHHYAIRYSYSSSSSNHVRYSSPAKHSLKLTEAARNQLLEIRKRDGKPYSLRVTVVPGGCHGFQINLNLEEEMNNNSVAEDDVYLNVEKGSPPLLIVDKTSLELINGAEVDFVSELIGSSFQVLKIPNAQSGCGCGVSFDLKQQ